MSSVTSRIPTKRITLSSSHEVDITTGEALNSNNRLSQELGITQAHFNQTKVFVLQAWWPNLCRSAHNSRFSGTLFDPFSFSGNGLLNADDPKFARIVRALIQLCVHVEKKLGVEAPKQWTVKWSVDGKKYFIIKARSKDNVHKINMNAPLLGWVAGGAGAPSPSTPTGYQLQPQQKKRWGAGVTAPNTPSLPPQRKQNAWVAAPTSPSPPQPQKKQSSWARIVTSGTPKPTVLAKASITKTEKSAIEEDEDIVEVPSHTPKKDGTPVRLEASQLDNEDWAMVDEVDFDV